MQSLLDCRAAFDVRNLRLMAKVMAHVADCTRAVDDASGEHATDVAKSPCAKLTLYPCCRRTSGHGPKLASRATSPRGAGARLSNIPSYGVPAVSVPEFLRGTPRNTPTVTTFASVAASGWQGAQMNSTGPLTGVRVIDLTAMVMGPYCTQIMADMGADVIKIEPPAGDDTRYVSVGPAHGLSGVFVNDAVPAGPGPDARHADLVFRTSGPYRGARSRTRCRHRKWCWRSWDWPRWRAWRHPHDHCANSPAPEEVLREDGRPMVEPTSARYDRRNRDNHAFPRPKS
jgi:CoA transferase family III